MAKGHPDIAYPLCWLVIVVAVAVYMALQPDPLEVEHAAYCEMVELYKADPDVGWPDYKGTYDTHCPGGASYAQRR